MFSFIAFQSDLGNLHSQEGRIWDQIVHMELTDIDCLAPRPKLLQKTRSASTHSCCGELTLLVAFDVRAKVGSGVRPSRPVNM